MKHLLLSLAVLFSTLTAFGQNTTWTLDNTHSSVKFTVTHMMISEVEGSFKTFKGTLVSKGSDFANADATFSVDVNSVSTDDEKRDGHLKSPDFFDVAKYPAMTFKSTGFKKSGTNTYTISGDLTIKDVTKKVNFVVINPPVVKDPYGNMRAGFRATTAISRKAFHLTWNQMTEAGGAIVSDEVAVKINLEYTHR